MAQRELQAIQRAEDLESGRGQVRRKNRGFSWPIALLLLSALFLNYIDRQSLSVLVRFLPSDLKMSNIVYGHITSAFLLAYALAMPLAGWFVDRVGTRMGLAITVSAWSLFELLCGTAQSVMALGTFRFLLGIPEAAALPSVAKVAAEHAAPHARATLVGIAMFGLGMGATFAPPVVVFLTSHFSWRWAFYGTGLAGFAWVLFWLIFYRADLSAAALARSTEPKVPWLTLLRDRNVIGLTVTHVFSASVWWFYLFWIPPFLNQERRLNIHEIGIYGWIPFFFATIGSVFGGYASGALVRRGWEPVKARKTIMWACTAIVPFTSLVVKAYGLAAVLAILGIATFFIQGYIANLFALAADIFPHERVASVVGLNVMCNALAAIAVIQFTGHMVERFSYTPAFILVAFLLPAASICMQWLVCPQPGVCELGGQEGE
ncbi:MAG: MFS transporter [Acidobacteria bacterium]|nr:MFS transporter [Acidobacteriota bacterium]